MLTRLRRGFTLVELLIVVVVLAGVIALLLPALSKARKSAVASRMMSEYDQRQGAAAPSRSPAAAGSDQSQAGEGLRQPAAANISSFEADITLTPRLSVGTAEPESIYEAKFAAKLKAVAPASGNGNVGNAGKDSVYARIALPLPPEIISLADLSIIVDGQPSDSDDMGMGQQELIWMGKLSQTIPSTIDITYAAVGRGLYALQTPPGKIVDQFKITLTAAGSDVRMLDLSMQPTELKRESGQTIYTWNYKKLMFGRPIALDVLGIAPIDRLGELTWLGPLSLIAFGLVIGLVAYSAGAVTFDRWVLLLVLGTFAGAYPLMYFAQEFISLPAAIATAGGIVVLIIGLRAITIMGFKLGFAGVMVPAALIMTVTIAAALRPSLQGILLTGSALALFVLGMMLAPKLKWPVTQPPLPVQAA
ncbi:prepilin-type N-terminal cleavage/methylation domain-containing protein [Humisphaera borealis]|uniref:Prepilin-type N-terminal cleavage/methylation domain-containing protein n=1 Tax=Humisphaera borealis TaxID=2807512 RepID=A0A7M2WU98_9BACT|nr:prepilin-type N-terminal cleavage/methylation domain-containing protein [Humisphaera borealis]QOV89056.1 prepilin-type N-terminal cleavage/methylation domain-containing protein [Humisphaera borealis]